ncbi:MAG: hypothetical protein P4L84_34920 [Isosphaeraceae bacterium]|nr:hypothetical protein [Isosphaeraceae bacterium]
MQVLAGTALLVMLFVAAVFVLRPVDPVSVDVVPVDREAVRVQDPADHVFFGSVMSAGRKVYPGIGGERWIASLTQDEWEAVMLNRLKGASGNIERFILEGYIGELPAFIRLLENDVDTPATHAAARGLRRLIPLARPGVKPFPNGHPESHWADGKLEESDEVCEEVNRELEPLEAQIDRDVENYFRRRWGRR